LHTSLFISSRRNALSEDQVTAVSSLQNLIMQNLIIELKKITKTAAAEKEEEEEEQEQEQDSNWSSRTRTRTSLEDNNTGSQ